MIVFDMSLLSRHIDSITAQLDETLDKGLGTMAEVVETNAKSSRKFKNQTGKLRAGIKAKRLSPLAWRVSTDQGYSNYVEFGNNQKGPWIYPVRAKALRFVMDGQVIFAKRVRSHGPLPFLQPAADLARSFQPDFFHLEVTRLIERTKPNA